MGQTDWPDPDVAVLNQLKINVINTNDGLSLEGYDIKVVLPNGTTKEFNGNTGTFTFDGTTEGTYVITASKEGYLAESTVINVSNDQTEAVSTVTQHVFFLNKKKEALMLFPNRAQFFMSKAISLPPQQLLLFRQAPYLPIRTSPLLISRH